MLSNVIRINPQQPAVAEACHWHEAFESVTQSNIKIACAWQRMLWRFAWGL
jgi:hypothetical protein